MQVINHVRMSLLAAWLGGAIYFSTIVAPSAFRVLRSFSLSNANEIAGTIVTRTLSTVNRSGMFLSLFLIITAFATRKYYGRASFIFQNMLLVIVAISTGLGEWVIAPKMRDLRAAMHEQIDQVPLNDPNRLAFAALHGYSVTALSVAMGAALVVILLMVFSRDNAVGIASE